MNHIKTECKHANVSLAVQQIPPQHENFVGLLMLAVRIDFDTSLETNDCPVRQDKIPVTPEIGCCRAINIICELNQTQQPKQIQCIQKKQQLNDAQDFRKGFRWTDETNVQLQRANISGVKLRTAAVQHVSGRMIVWDCFASSKT